MSSEKLNITSNVMKSVLIKMLSEMYDLAEEDTEDKFFNKSSVEGKENIIDKLFKKYCVDNETKSILLKTLREVQIEYPDSHVGGSVGLFLRGIELPRKWIFSDLDIINSTIFSKHKLTSFICNDEVKYGSNSGGDFKIKLYKNSIKIEIAVDIHQKFDYIECEGFKYRVSKLEEIIKWKLHYANKGIIKHKDDIDYIKSLKLDCLDESIFISNDYNLPF